MRDVDLPAVYAQKIRFALAANRTNALIRIGVKTEIAQFLKKWNIVMNAMKIAEKDC